MFDRKLLNSVILGTKNFSLVIHPFFDVGLTFEEKNRKKRTITSDI